METQTTTPQTPADRAGTVGHETKQAAGDIASTAGQEAKQVTREAKDQVQALWSQTRRDLTEQAATQQTRVAGSLRELADQLGSMAGAADQDGMAVGLVDDVAPRAACSRRRAASRASVPAPSWPSRPASVCWPGDSAAAWSTRRVTRTTRPAPPARPLAGSSATPTVAPLVAPDTTPPQGSTAPAASVPRPAPREPACPP